MHRKFNQLGIRPVGKKMLDWGTCPREAVPEGPRLSSPKERERNAVMANRVEVNMMQFCSVSNSLSHTTLSIKWEVYFSKELCRSSLLCRYAYAYEYTTGILWYNIAVCNLLVSRLFTRNCNGFQLITIIRYLKPHNSLKIIIIVIIVIIILQL